MAGPEHAEVPVVERRELLLTQRLDHCEHRCVAETDIGVGMSVAELLDPSAAATSRSRSRRSAGRENVVRSMA